MQHPNSLYPNYEPEFLYFEREPPLETRRNALCSFFRCAETLNPNPNSCTLSLEPLEIRRDAMCSCHEFAISIVPTSWVRKPLESRRDVMCCCYELAAFLLCFPGLVGLMGGMAFPPVHQTPKSDLGAANTAGDVLERRIAAAAVRSWLTVRFKGFSLCEACHAQLANHSRPNSMRVIRLALGHVCPAYRSRAMQSPGLSSALPRSLDRRRAEPLAGLSVLDVGCGGGLLTEVRRALHPASEP